MKKIKDQINAFLGKDTEFQGKLSFKSRIEIHAPGRVFGNIQAPVVTIDEGVVFEGNCQMQIQSADVDRKVAILQK
jgi:cytoskeletal protein CcmA (bactofilin family)